ncbi:hypothetical protein C8R44DRAFT_728254 [Mycena epipterygia]|nr:hypothetical protein C8R44DRAFT_728254 [Mycena epipterygia]
MQPGIASISGGREGKEEKSGFNEGKRRRRRGCEEDMNGYVAWSRACGVRAAGREGGCIQTKDGDCCVNRRMEKNQWRPWHTTNEREGKCAHVLGANKRVKHEKQSKLKEAGASAQIDDAPAQGHASKMASKSQSEGSERVHAQIDASCIVRPQEKNALFFVRAAKVRVRVREVCEARNCNRVPGSVSQASKVVRPVNRSFPHTLSEKIRAQAAGHGAFPGYHLHRARVNTCANRCRTANARAASQPEKDAGISHRCVMQVRMCPNVTAESSRASSVRNRNQAIRFVYTGCASKASNHQSSGRLDAYDLVQTDYDSKAMLELDDGTFSDLPVHPHANLGVHQLIYRQHAYYTGCKLSEIRESKVQKEYSIEGKPARTTARSMTRRKHIGARTIPQRGEGTARQGNSCVHGGVNFVRHPDFVLHFLKSHAPRFTKTRLPGNVRTKHKMMYLILCIIPHAPARIVELCASVIVSKRTYTKRLLTDALNNTSDSDQQQPGKNRRNHMGENVRTRAIDGWITSRNVGMRQEETIQGRLVLEAGSRAVNYPGINEHPSERHCSVSNFQYTALLRLRMSRYCLGLRMFSVPRFSWVWWAMSQLVRDSRCYPDLLSADPRNDQMDGMGMRYQETFPHLSIRSPSQSWPGTRPVGQLSTINLSASVGIVNPPFLAVGNEPRLLIQASRFLLFQARL